MWQQHFNVTTMNLAVFWGILKCSDIKHFEFYMASQILYSSATERYKAVVCSSICSSAQKGGSSLRKYFPKKMALWVFGPLGISVPKHYGFNRKFALQTKENTRKSAKFEHQ